MPAGVQHAGAAVVWLAVRRRRSRLPGCYLVFRDRRRPPDAPLRSSGAAGDDARAELVRAAVNGRPARGHAEAVAGPPPLPDR